MTAPAYADVGPLVVATDVDDAVIATLRMWLPTYMSIIEAERSLAFKLARPAASSYANALEDDEWLDRTVPAVIVTTASTNAEPSLAPDGTYLAAWRTIVSPVVRGQTGSQTRYNAALTEGCVRRALTQHPTLGGLEMTLKWRRTQIAPFATKTSRYLAAGISEYMVWTDNAAKETLGPSAPDAAPYDDLPLVTEIDIDLTANPIPQGV